MALLTYEEIRKNEEIRTYIKKADAVLSAMGYTEHSFAHMAITAERAGEILLKMGYPERTAELARIAGFMHDIGNVINRIDHAQSGAVMAFRILDRLGMPADELADVVSAIGNHDEGTAVPATPIAAALILADKADVRRSRVRNTDQMSFDIHDRVNYSVESSSLTISEDKNRVELRITIDTEICAVMSYFEIFLERMLLCRRAAEFLGRSFALWINDQRLL
ncbi:MAG: HD domain-containing protein [Oscillospiraceae bacterium]|nr:HD domain-containing protein [Oscillospiraceae bacterium]